MDIRTREPHDLGACVRMLAEVHHGDGYPADWPASPARWLSPSGLLGAWVAVAPDGPAAGHVTLSRSGPGDAAPELWSRRTGTSAGAAAVLGRLFVSPAARGRGVAALLVDRAVRAAAERGLHPVLDVLDSDGAAVALYERLGWDLLGTARQRWSPTRTVTVHCYAAPADLPA
ncbi:GNAT family N-acetyltransferase [Streptomyces sp. NPDC048507]|uniref:GNAT family N-acetyltransferase n=1 Tax=Streptomyces sp. NPDC048507 TaxID=3365560 RepID=UPI00371E87D8